MTFTCKTDSNGLVTSVSGASIDQESLNGTLKSLYAKKAESQDRLKDGFTATLVRDSSSIKLKLVPANGSKSLSITLREDQINKIMLKTAVLPASKGLDQKTVFMLGTAACTATSYFFSPLVAASLVVAGTAAMLYFNYAPAKTTLQSAPIEPVPAIAAPVKALRTLPAIDPGNPHKLLPIQLALPSAPDQKPTIIEVKVVKDICALSVDAIVNAANTALAAGSGVCGAIYNAGGQAIFDECAVYKKTHPVVKEGDAIITGSGKLATSGIQFVIHAVGPTWNPNDTEASDRALYDAYYNALIRAQENNVASIALPSLSTGVFSFPLDRAAPIAMRAVKEFIQKNPQTCVKQIVFAVWPDCLTAYASELAAPVISMVPPPALAVAVAPKEPDYQALETVIARLKSSTDPVSKKKGALLQQGLERAKAQKLRDTLTTARLKDTSSFAMSKGTPAYLQHQKFTPQSLSFEITAAFYDYQLTPGKEDYWVDFANASLGGGCFSHGFVQEEIMVHEMPNFALHIAQSQSKTHPGWCDIPTRDRGNGSPNPYLLKGVQRVQAVDNGKAYGHNLSLITQADLLSSTNQIPTQTVNLLAIAAPKLPSKNPQDQFDRKTLVDIYNTIAAGFQLVQEQGGGVIHSGKLSCGAFNNDQKAVYLLHRLAADQMGMSLKLHGYSKSEQTENETAWKSLLPQLRGQSLDACLTTISQYLQGKSIPALVPPPKASKPFTIQGNPRIKGSASITIPIGAVGPDPLSDGNFGSVAKTANVATLNQPYAYDPSQQIVIGGITIYRPNHNGTHSARQARTLEAIFKMVETRGDSGVQQIYRSLSVEEKQHLKLGAYFMRAGRSDESSHKDANPDDYYTRSAMIYEAYARQLGTSEATIQWVKKLIINSCKPKGVREADIDTDPKNRFGYECLTIVHELDLIRCFGATLFKTNLEAIQNRIDTYFVKKPGSTVNELMSFAKKLCEVTGSNRVYDKYTGNMALFSKCSQDGELCWKAVQVVPLPF